jgi:hypothetical protein
VPLFLLDLIGATLALVLIVNIFRLIAGVRFSHWRHIIAAYLAGFIAAVAIYAMVSGNLSEFDRLLSYAVGGIIGASLEFLYLSRRARPISHG